MDWRLAKWGPFPSRHWHPLRDHMGGDIAKSPLVATAQLFSGGEHHFLFRARNDLAPEEDLTTLVLKKFESVLPISERFWNHFSWGEADFIWCFRRLHLSAADTWNNFYK